MVCSTTGLVKKHGGSFPDIQTLLERWFQRGYCAVVVCARRGSRECCDAVTGGTCDELNTVNDVYPLES